MPEDSKISKAQQRAVHEYVKRNYDRIELTVKPKGKKEQIKAHADTLGETLNAFINRAIDETMQRDSSPIEKPVCQDTHKITDPTLNPTILSPDVLEKAQNAAAESGETVPEFVSRAVKTQVKRDEATWRMGLDPVTGGMLKHQTSNP